MAGVETNGERLDEIVRYHAQGPGWLMEKNRARECSFLLCYAVAARNLLKGLMANGHIPEKFDAKAMNLIK